MRWIRGVGIALAAGFLILLIASMRANPLFLKDLMQAVLDIQLELSITGLLVIAIGWWGWEMHRRITRRAERPSRLQWSPRKQQRLRRPTNGRPSLPRRHTLQRDFEHGISTELIGAFISTLLLGMVVLIFQQYSAIQNQKAQLILQLGSPDNSVAIEAVRQLRQQGYGESWIEDGTLKGIVLWDADLRETALEGADLRQASLVRTVLWRVDLRYANLREADLRFADLRRASLVGATLPDGTKWTPNTDIGRFTNPGHSDFWCSHDSDIPPCQ